MYRPRSCLVQPARAVVMIIRRFYIGQYLDWNDCWTTGKQYTIYKGEFFDFGKSGQMPKPKISEHLVFSTFHLVHLFFLAFFAASFATDAGGDHKRRMRNKGSNLTILELLGNELFRGVARLYCFGPNLFWWFLWVQLMKMEFWK